MESLAIPVSWKSPMGGKSHDMAARVKELTKVKRQTRESNMKSSICFRCAKTGTHTNNINPPTLAFMTCFESKLLLAAGSIAYKISLHIPTPFQSL